jgi:hypothetical protein
MATSTYLSGITTLTVNAVDVADQCTMLSVTNLRETLDQTTLTNSSRRFRGGLYNNEITMTLFQSYVAGETFATISPLVGVTTTIVATVTDGAVSKVITLANCYLESMPLINANLGELSTVDLTFVGGELSIA